MEEIEMQKPSTKPRTSGMRPIYRFEIPNQTDKKTKKNKKTKKLDVSEPYELKKLPNCDSYECSDPSPSSSDLYICCNPYHWSRRCKSDSPPPPYRRFSNERLKPEDKAPSESDLICDHISRQIELRGSLTTNGEGHQIVGPREESKSSHVHNDYLPAAATYQVGTFCLVLSLDHDYVDFVLDCVR
ncbi:hypothetical protein M8J77_006879 [Diaphorina citri]|nr:hypothetical protein M8J77_006879 [Diaphorina citri]